QLVEEHLPSVCCDHHLDVIALDHLGDAIYCPPVGHAQVFGTGMVLHKLLSFVAPPSPPGGSDGMLIENRARGGRGVVKQIVAHFYRPGMIEQRSPSVQPDNERGGDALMPCDIRGEFIYPDHRKGPVAACS